MFPATGYVPKQKPALMGIVNTTGDSFSEGALSSSKDALARALRLLEDGADMLDLGGESTRPGAIEVPEQEEIRRLGTLVSELKKRHPEIPVSVDTRHAETARLMLDMGADIINDVSMLRFDRKMADVIAENKKSIIILCHSRGTPQNMNLPEHCNYGSSVLRTVCKELEEAAASSGIEPERIWFDPGFGFAKTVEQQLELLRETKRFTGNFPCTVYGVSRKSFIGKITGVENPQERTAGTLACELYLAGCGVNVIRTHNVKALKEALAVQNAITKTTGE